MKKILTLILAATMLLPAMAQNISRSGNTYQVDGQLMNKKSFDAYMQEKAKAQWATQFHNALKLSNVGWGLFGGSLGLGVVGLVTIGASSANITNVSAFEAGAFIGYGMFILGDLATTAGIVCLGVGYGRMHNAADCYGVACRSNRPQAYWSINTNQNGLGLALNF